MHRTGVALNYRGGRPSRQEVASEHGCFVMIISDGLLEVVILCDGDSGGSLRCLTQVSGVGTV